MNVCHLVEGMQNLARSSAEGGDPEHADSLWYQSFILWFAE
jgi:hypothetical protein